MKGLTDILEGEAFASISLNTLPKTHPKYGAVDAAELGLLTDMLVRHTDEHPLPKDAESEQLAQQLKHAYQEAGIAQGEHTADELTIRFLQRAEGALLLNRFPATPTRGH